MKVEANKPTVVLKAWEISKRTYMPSLYTYLEGNAYGHPRFPDGTAIITSYIHNVTKMDDYFIVETKNTLYYLERSESKQNIEIARLEGRSDEE